MEDALPRVVKSLEEAGDELFTMYRFPKQHWKNIRTTNVIERLNGEFRRRVKTQGSLPSEDAALLQLFGLIATGQIKLRKIDGYRKLAGVISEQMRRAARCQAVMLYGESKSAGNCGHFKFHTKRDATYRFRGDE